MKSSIQKHLKKVQGKPICFILFLIFSLHLCYSQSILSDSYKQNVSSLEVMPCLFLKDINKKLSECISSKSELLKRINQLYFYDETEIKWSISYLIKQYASYGGKGTYYSSANIIKTYEDTTLSNRLTVQEIDDLNVLTDTITLPNSNNSKIIDKVLVAKEFTFSSYLVKEEWLYTNFLIGINIQAICPIYTEYDTLGNYISEKVLYCISFPNANPVFINVANPFDQNDLVLNDLFITKTLKSNFYYWNNFTSAYGELDTIDKILETEAIKKRIYNLVNLK